MPLIDRYAYTNRLRDIDPLQKGSIAIGVMLLCLLLNHLLVSIVTIGWMIVLLVFWARIPWGVVLQLLFAEAMFLMLSGIGIMVSVALVEPLPIGATVHTGPVWLTVTEESFYRGALIISRALGSVAAMNFLALTTPLPDILDLLRRLRMPIVLIDLTSIMYRHIFLLLETVGRIHTAQASRLGYGTFGAALRSSAVLASRVFVDAYWRGHRMERALASRGYFGGNFPVIPIQYRPDVAGYGIGAVVGLTMVLVWGMW